jgi:hypothetical protein
MIDVSGVRKLTLWRRSLLWVWLAASAIAAAATASILWLAHAARARRAGSEAPAGRH